MAKGIVIPIRIKQVGEAALKRMGKDFDALSDKAKKNSKVFEELNKSLKSASFAFGGTSTSIAGFTMGMGSIAKVSGTAALGLMVAVKAVKLLTDTMVAATKTGAEFESTISNLQAQGGLSTDKIAELSVVIRELGASTKFTATEVAKGATELAKMGKSSEEISKMLPAITGFAAAVGTDFTTASTTAVNIMNQFGLEAENTQVVVDFMSNSFRSSALDIGKFSTIMGYVGPIAASTGNSLEETATAAGLLADAGFKASKVGTGLRTIMLELGDAGSKASKLISEQAKAQGVVESTSLSLGQKLKILKDSYVDATVATDIFGKRAAAQSLVLINAGQRYDELAKKISNYEKASEEMAATQLDNVAGAFTILKSVTDNALLSLFEGFGPTLQNGIENTSRLVNDVAFAIEGAVERSEHWVTAFDIVLETAIRVFRTIIASLNEVAAIVDVVTNSLQYAWRQTFGRILDDAIRIYNKIPFFNEIENIDSIEQYADDVSAVWDRLYEASVNVQQAMGIAEEDSLIARSEANGRYYDKAITDRINFGAASLKVIKKNGELISDFQSQMNEDELTDLEKKQLTERTNLQVALKQQEADLTDHYDERLRIVEAAGDSGALQALRTQQARELKAIQEQNGRVLTAQTELHKKQGELDEKRRQRRERAVEKAIADWKRLQEAINNLEIPDEGLLSTNQWSKKFAEIRSTFKKESDKLIDQIGQAMEKGAGSKKLEAALDKLYTVLDSKTKIFWSKMDSAWSGFMSSAQSIIDKNLPSFAKKMTNPFMEVVEELEEMEVFMSGFLGDMRDPFESIKLDMFTRMHQERKKAIEAEQDLRGELMDSVSSYTEHEKALNAIGREYRKLARDAADALGVNEATDARNNSQATIALLKARKDIIDQTVSSLDEVILKSKANLEVQKEGTAEYRRTEAHIADAVSRRGELAKKGKEILEDMEEEFSILAVSEELLKARTSNMDEYLVRLRQARQLELDRLNIAQERAKTTFEVELQAADPTNVKAQLDKANNLFEQAYNARAEFIMQNYTDIDERQKLLQEAQAVRDQELDRLKRARERAKATFEIELSAADPKNFKAQLDKANNLVEQSYNDRTEFIMQNYADLDERQRLLQEAQAVREQESLMASVNQYATWGDTVAGYLNQALSLQSQLADAERSRIERRLEDEKGAIKRLEKLGTISARTAAQREEKATQQARARQEEIFESQKRIAKMQALINGAVAVTKAFADYGWPVGAVIGATVAGLTAAQVGVIDSQQFATGGFPAGANANVTMNERGQESILNASATSRLGRRAIEDLNAGRSVDFSTGSKVDTNASSSPTFIYSPSHTFNTSSQDTDIFAALEQDREKFSEFINDTRSRGYAV
jgi:TP901 family phage tail tape measure protein